MKKKAMIMAVASLGSMALIGTGFAGWVISANTSTDAKGVITAYDVKDQRLTISDQAWTAKEDDGSGSIIFGQPAAKETFDKPWFTFTNDVRTEVLGNTFTFKVSSGDNKDTGNFKVAAEIVVAEETKTAWEDAITGNVVAEPAVDAGGTAGVYTLAETGTTVTIGLTFNWGSHFGTKNPYNFYNTKKIGDKINEEPATVTTWGDDAAAFMGYFDKIQSVKFNLKITVTRQ